MSWLLILPAVALIWWGARRLDRFEADLDADDWTLPMLRPSLDRRALLDLPYSPCVSDEDALAALAWVRGLPEVAA